MDDNSTLNPVELATELTVAWLGNPNNRISSYEAPVFLRQMYATILELSGGAPADAHASGNDGEETFTPAVSVRKSLASKDHIISMIDGKPYKTLRRHLSTHGLTPEDYPKRYNLKIGRPSCREECDSTVKSRWSPYN